MHKPRNVLAEALDDIKPKQQDEKDTKERINFIVSRLQARLSNAKVILGGSGAKGTWLRNSYDADIFVLFDYRKYSDKSGQLSDILEKSMKKAFAGKRISRIHGSRDYFQIIHENSTFEIVPILNIRKAESAKNITDVSPLHAGWVNRQTDGRLKDDIRLAKQFCKANGLYGAESYINGFSGYVLEVLVVHYRGVLQFLRAAAKWSEKINKETDKIVIDAKKHYKNKSDALFTLNKSKIQSPVIVVDPVQKDRNAAAALSMDKYRGLIYAAKAFLKKPGKDFFEIKGVTVDELKKKETASARIHIFTAVPLHGKKDVVGAKLLKTFEMIRKSASDAGFDMRDAGWHWDNKKDALLWYVIGRKKLDAYIVHAGPPVKMKKFADIFKAKYKNSFVRNGKLYAKVKRKYVESEKLLRDIINDDYVRERVKSIKLAHK